MNKIPNVSDLVKKTHDSRLFTASDYNKFAGEVCDKKIKEKGLVDKSDISGVIDNSDLDKKVATQATKAKLKAEQDKIMKVQVFHSSYICGKNHFKDDATKII